MYTMLVIDDEVWIRERLISTIDWAAHDIEIIGEACDGAEGLKIAIEKNPDVILTDIKMPVLDGLELVKTLRQENIMSKVIIISGYNDFEYAQKAIRLGADDYILKPVDDDDLISAVTRCIDDLIYEKDRQNLLHDAISNNSDILINTEHLINNIKVRDKEGTLASLQAILIKIYNDGKKYTINKNLIYVNIINLIIKTIYEGKEIPAEITLVPQNMLQKLQNSKTEYEVEEIINKTVLSLVEYFEKMSSFGKSKIIKKIQHYVEENYKDPISLNDVSKMLYLNPSYLSKTFKDETGEPFTKYLMKFRVEKAIELMSDPSLKIYEIANLVGYEDIQYFTKIFKSIKGVTISQYKDKIKP